MKVAPVKAPDGLDKIAIEERVTPTPGPGEVQVRVRASSLNFHGFAVVAGMNPVPDGRIPMSDGAGEVTAVGSGVKIWKVGDPVLSTFPNWSAGGPTLPLLIGVSDDHADGSAAEYVVMPATAFMRIATRLVDDRGRHPALRRLDRLARPGGGGADQAG